MLDRNDKHFDALETRSADERAADQLVKLNAQLASNGMAAVAGLEELAGLPVLRKSDLVARQEAEAPPFGGLPVSNLAHVFQSPGPIYEPGGVSHGLVAHGPVPARRAASARAISCRTAFQLPPDAGGHDL
jgi:phenylacetate-CoA ligase